MAYLRLFVAAAVGAFASGCLIQPDDDDTGGGGTDPTSPSGPGSNTNDPSVATTSPSESGPGTGDGTDSGVLPPGCSDNLLGDPGFEGGTPNGVWLENSAVFGTPICDASCTEEEGAVPYSGDWWVWFGGIEQQETASVSQQIVISPDQAILQFRFWVNTGAGEGNDTFTVDIDGMNVFLATDLDQATYNSYTLVEVDVSEYADNETHTVSFGAELAGVGLTNFFLDDVLLVSCTEGEGSTTMLPPTGTTTTPTTTMGDTSTTATDDTVGTDTMSMTSSTTMEPTSGTTAGDTTAGTATTGGGG